MFQNAAKFNQDISKWDTEKVTAIRQDWCKGIYALQICEKCGAGQYRNKHNYKFIGNKKTWDEHETCASRSNTHLASVTNKFDLKKFQGIAQGMWIGGKQNDANQWEWSDGTQWSYENWMVGEPNSLGEDRLVIGANLRWNDLANGHKVSAIYKCAECEVCADGKYSDQTGEETCKDHMTCGAGTYSDYEILKAQRETARWCREPELCYAGDNIESCSKMDTKQDCIGSYFTEGSSTLGKRCYWNGMEWL